MPRKLRTVFERGLNLYVVAPCMPLTPSMQDIEQYAFGNQVEEHAYAKRVEDQRTRAPNPHIAWFGGHYVEADNPNANGAMWTADEIAIKSVTPTYMPVTVMHDPRTAVGTIADVGLKTPDADQVPRSKLETVLALWAHRFPDAVEEAQHNYEQGSLMQSMECFAPDYDCSTCGSAFHKLPDGAEREMWCDCLKASDPTAGYIAAGNKNSTAVRILRNVTFTGTGLIFGSRNARGADSQAYLESFAEEVAEFHQDQRDRHNHKSSRPKPRRTRTVMDPIEVAKQEYDGLVAAKAERDGAVKRADEAEEATETLRTENATLKEQVDSLTKERDEAVEAKEAAETKATEAEEAVNQETMAKERIDALGDGFKAKLGDKTKANLERDAKAMSDEDWKARTEELAENLGVELDAEGGTETAGAGESLFTKEEVARSQAGGAGGESRDAKSGAVVKGLFSQATNK